MTIRRPLLVALFMVSAASGCNRGDDDPASEASGRPLVADPVAWTNAFFDQQCLPGEAVAHEVDLDGDGANELLVETTAGSGTGGANHVAFGRDGDGYRLLGMFFGHGVRPLPPAPDGAVRLVTWWHLSSQEGDIRWLVARGGRFALERRERVRAGDGGTDEGNRRLAEVFGDRR